MFKSINPVNNQVLKSYAAISDKNLEDKLSLAHSIYNSFWKNITLEERVQCILKVKKDLENHVLDYAKLITLEMGKPITQSKAEIEKCAILCDYYAENSKTFLADEFIKTEASKSFVKFQPIGAVFGIMPWNFPFWQVFRYSVPALLAGNVVLLKHAPNVPQCALKIEEIFKNAIGEKGVFQSLFIDIDQVEKVIANEVVQGVTLTGSDRAGGSVAALAGKHIKKCVLELGGADAFIVLKDADLEKAAQIAVKSRMNNCGQTCISTKRIIVDETVADQFLALLSNEIAKLKIGDPLDPTTDLSCMARPDFVENLERQVTDSVEKGAVELLSGGRQPGDSNYFKPVILTNISREMAVYKEEVFGPVATVITFKEENEAIEIANDSDYGLGAAIWSNDLEKAEQIGSKIEAGAIAINNMVKSDPRMPFGGVKKSGFGRELSLEGIREFANIKSFSID